MYRRRVLRRANGEPVSRAILIARLCGKVSGLLLNLTDLEAPLGELTQRLDFAKGDGAQLLDKRTQGIIDNMKGVVEKWREVLPRMKELATKADELTRQATNGTTEKAKNPTVS